MAGATRGAADAAMSPLVPGTARLAEMPLERAAGLYSAANRTGLLVGLPAAGALIGLTTPATVVLLDGISFAVAAAMIAVLVPASTGAEKREEPLSLRAYGRDLREGLAFIRADRLLLGLSAMIALSNLFDQALMSVLLPVWVRDRLHSPSGLGVFGGALAAGLLGGVLLGTWIGPRLPRRWTYAVGFLLSGSPPFFALAMWDVLPPVAVVAFVAGVLGGVLNPLLGAVLYERVPVELHARVLGMSKASAWVGIPLGSLAGGVLTDAAGLHSALIGFGVAMLLTTLAPFVFPAFGEMERVAPADVPARIAA